MADPIDELFGASFTRFVEERKRLAAALKAAGEKLPAQRLAAINRPPISAWAINQLWRRARTEMDALFAAARKVREGDLGAMAIYREVLADLKARAAEILRGDGNAAGEAVLRRIAQTLQALAAAGGFDPDPPGQLTADRDPPGFEALAGAVLTPPPRKTKSRSDTEVDEGAREGEGDEETVADEGDAERDAETVAEEVEEVEEVEEIEEDDDEDDEADQAEARAELAAEARAHERAELEAALAAARRTETTANRDLAAAQTLLAAAQDRLARAEATANAARVRTETLTAELTELDDVVD